MNIAELMAEVGSENITFQVLTQAMSGAKLRKGGATEISFWTDAVSVAQATGITDSPMLGLVVWLPVDKLPAEIREKL
jgi:hypothetical protein